MRAARIGLRARAEAKHLRVDTPPICDDMAHVIRRIHREAVLLGKVHSIAEHLLVACPARALRIVPPRERPAHIMACSVFCSEFKVFARVELPALMILEHHLMLAHCHRITPGNFLDVLLSLVRCRGSFCGLQIVRQRADRRDHTARADEQGNGQRAAEIFPKMFHQSHLFSRLYRPYLLTEVIRVPCKKLLPAPPMRGDRSFFSSAGGP